MLHAISIFGKEIAATEQTALRRKKHLYLFFLFVYHLPLCYLLHCHTPFLIFLLSKEWVVKGALALVCLSPLGCLTAKLELSLLARACPLRTFKFKRPMHAVCMITTGRGGHH